MANALAAVKTIHTFARGFLQRLSFLRIHFCITELQRIPGVARVVDPHATEDTLLVLKLQGPEFPPRVVYAFTANKSYYQLLIRPALLNGADFQTSGASSRYRGEAAMTRFFVQRSHALTKYKDLFSYNKDSRRYITVLPVSTNSPSHSLLEMALLRCNRRISPPRSLPPAKALRARQLRMMFGLSQISSASSKDSQQSSMVKAPHQSEHVYDVLDASLLEFCNQMGIDPKHWSAVSTPDIQLDFDVRSPARRSPESSSPPIVDIARVPTHDSLSDEDQGEAEFAGLTNSVQHIVSHDIYSNAFITEQANSAIHLSPTKSRLTFQSSSPLTVLGSSTIHFVNTRVSNAGASGAPASEVPLNCTPMQPLLPIDPATPDDIIDAFFNTGSKQEAQNIFTEIGLLDTDDINL